MQMIENLDYLRLTFIKQNLDSIIEDANKNKPDYRQFLRKIIEAETVDKKLRNTNRRLQKAKLPFIKTLDQFDWTHPQTIDKNLILSLYNSDYIAKRENIIILGHPGSGKTHIASAFAQKACAQGYSVSFINPWNIITDTIFINNPQQIYKKYLKPKLLIIDNITAYSLNQNQAQFLFHIIAARYEKNSIFITANEPFNTWHKKFNNDISVASAIIDRIIHHSFVINIEAESFRMRDKLKNNS